MLGVFFRRRPQVACSGAAATRAPGAAGPVDTTVRSRRRVPLPPTAAAVLPPTATAAAERRLSVVRRDVARRQGVPRGGPSAGSHKAIARKRVLAWHAAHPWSSGPASTESDLDKDEGATIQATADTDSSGLSRLAHTMLQCHTSPYNW